ncbi:MAG: glycine cleavage system protein GcvH [Hyphomicrobiales bacterium]|nr:glycine cleavage system protein GcvH [Hyphomicrobiales bacterium]
MAKSRYTKDHEYARVEGDIATVGISEYAQEQLGDVVYVELPDIGRKFARGDDAAVVESVKAASEVYSPLSGEVVEVNSALADSPAQVNADAEGAGWIFKLRIGKESEVGVLMTEADYKTYLAEL